MISDQWLKEFYRGWSDESLRDRLQEVRTLTIFGGPTHEIDMLLQESKRRERESA